VVDVWGRDPGNAGAGLSIRKELSEMSAIAKPVVVVVALLVALSTAAPVLAESGGGASFCSGSGIPAGYDGDFDPAPNNVGEFVAWIAQNVGNSGANNPGNAQDPAPPFVPFVIGCNPTAP
jgi:hypothetical protein